jgi:hypothetical protein
LRVRANHDCKSVAPLACVEVRPRDDVLDADDVTVEREVVVAELL